MAWSTLLTALRALLARVYLFFFIRVQSFTDDALTPQAPLESTGRQRYVAACSQTARDGAWSVAPSTLVSIVDVLQVVWSCFGRWSAEWLGGVTCWSGVVCACAFVRARAVCTRACAYGARVHVCVCVCLCGMAGCCACAVADAPHHKACDDPASQTSSRTVVHSTLPARRTTLRRVR